MRAIFSRNFFRVRFLMSGVFSAALFLFGLLPVGAQAATELQYDGGYTYGLISQTLTKVRSPYIVHGGCAAATKIPIGATVTIEAGVIIKFTIDNGCGGGAGHIGVFGNLFVNGTPEEPVIFTSIRDDSVGGDTGGDGSATVPQPGNWANIELGNGSGAGSNTISVKNTIFRYGGFGSAYTTLAVYQGIGSLTLENIELSYSAGFGLMTRRPLTMTSSSFHNNTVGAINAENLWMPNVDARNNWWGDASGPQVSSNVLGRGQIFRGNVLYNPWIGKPPPNTAPTLQFVSGGGFDDGVEPNTAFLSQMPIFKVAYIDADNNSPAYVRVVVDGVPYVMSKDTGQDGFYTNGEQYTALATSTLVSGQHAYHFETSDGTATARLPASGELNFTLKNDPVIIIPGILGSAQKNGAWVIDPILHTYDNLIDTFKVNGYTDGVDLFTFPYDWHQSNVLTGFQLHQKIDEIKTICNCGKVDLVAHSMGGLAARQYIQSNYYEHDVDQLIFLGTPHLGAPNAYLTWEAGETGTGLLNSFKEFVFSREAKKLGFLSIYDYIRSGSVESVRELLPIYDYIKEKNTGIFRMYPTHYPQNIFLENLSNSVNSLLNSGARITNIVGDLGVSSTIDRIRVINSSRLPLWGDGYPENYDVSFTDRGLENGNGDKTVPLFSSMFIKVGLKVLASEHGNLPTEAEQQVLGEIARVSHPTIINNFHFNNYKLLIIKILSPADIVVIAPDGKRVGKDFITGQEFHEIDGAFYSGFVTDNEYITIPNPLDGEYRVQAQGTGIGGEYTIAAGYISDDSLASKDFQANILHGMISELKVEVNSSIPQELVVTPTDNVLPEITILSPMAQNYERPFVLPLLFTATDTDSGVYSQSLSFDGKLAASGDMFDLFFQPLGAHVVSATATDFMGNVATATISFNLIASVNSTISDIERSYSLGWINNAGIKKSLIKKLREIKEERKEKDNERRQGDSRREDREDEKKTKEEFNEFLRELKKQRGKHINEQAFLLIQEDINWLINN